MKQASNGQALSVDHLINNWNLEFPQYQLKISDLKDPPKVIGALFQVFNRLGLDCDAIAAPPPENERDEHTPYYWDLLPFINVTRVVKHLMPQVDSVSAITLSLFLQPTVTTTHPILLLLFNLMIFNESQMGNITPYEEELFGKREQVKILEERKTKLQELLNEQAKEKGKRAERLEEIDHDIRQYESELKQEKEAHDEEKQELAVVVKENQHMEMTVDQKRTHKEALMTEVNRKRALRVYDAKDIKTQAEQATQNVQEAEEKLESLKETLMQKETALKNLLNVKPNLDSANNLLHDIVKLSTAFKELDTANIEPDDMDGEMDALEAELRDAQAHLAELKSAREEFSAKRKENQIKRQEEKAIAMSAIEEAEQSEKKSRESSEKAMVRIDEIKQLTAKYEEEKRNGIAQLSQIKDQFLIDLKTLSDEILTKTLQAEKRIENCLANVR